MVSTRNIQARFFRTVIFILLQIWSNQIIRGGASSQNSKWVEKGVEVDNLFRDLKDWVSEE